MSPKGARGAESKQSWLGIGMSALITMFSSSSLNAPHYALTPNSVALWIKFLTHEFWEIHSHRSKNYFAEDKM